MPKGKYLFNVIGRENGPDRLGVGKPSAEVLGDEVFAIAIDTDDGWFLLVLGRLLFARAWPGSRSWGLRRSAWAF